MSIEYESGKMPLRSRKRWKEKITNGSSNTESRAKKTKNLEEKMTKRTEVKNLGEEMMRS